MSVFGIVLLVALVGARPDGAGPKSQAEQVRDILSKQCTECHGAGKDVRANLKILDYARLTNRDRHLVIPNNPDESELLRLVDAGCMPPGTRPKVSENDRKTLRSWISAGAMPFPSFSGEPYILAQIKADVGRLKANELPNVRYISLNHLFDEATDPNDFKAHRAVLTRTLNLLSTNGKPVQLFAIDPQETIYRIRLDELGWDSNPYGQIGPKNPDLDPAQINLYDLILLEYPMVELPDASPLGKDLIASYLKPTNVLRPVLYIRGDWLAYAADKGFFVDAIPKQPEKPGDRNALQDLAKQYISNPIDSIPPLDALSLPDSEPAKATTKVELTTFAGAKPARTFFPMEDVTFHIKNGGAKEITYQLVAISSSGQKIQVPSAVGDKDVVGGGENTFPIKTSKKLGKEQMTIFASEGPIPSGVLCHAKAVGSTVVDRFIHPLYKIGADGRSIQTLLDPTTVVKKTVSWETIAR
jgi:Planctomycete cytochrome C